MKKIIMALVCLMAITMSANAQNNIDIDHVGIDYKFFHYDKFNDSMGLKLNAETTILVEHVRRDIFELNMYREEKGVFGTINLAHLYFGNLNGMITRFNTILDKSKKWHKICVENNSPSLNKKINVDGDMFCYNNETHTYLVKLPKKNSGEDEKAFNEQDLIRILEYIKNFDISKYLEEEKNKEEEEQHRKNVLNLLN